MKRLQLNRSSDREDEAQEAQGQERSHAPEEGAEGAEAEAPGEGSSSRTAPAGPPPGAASGGGAGAWEAGDRLHRAMGMGSAAAGAPAPIAGPAGGGAAAAGGPQARGAGAGAADPMKKEGIATPPKGAPTGRITPEVAAKQREKRVAQQQAGVGGNKPAASPGEAPPAPVTGAPPSMPQQVGPQPTGEMPHAGESAGAAAAAAGARGGAAGAAGGAGDDIDALIQQMEHAEDPAKRKQAIDGLTRSTSAKARAALETAAHSPNHALARAARAALHHMAR